MIEAQRETWSIEKPVVHSQRGIVVSQHAAASAVGVDVLRAGGNAVDAAVATGFSIGVLEPWMSGIGGGGCLLVYLAEQDECWAVDFGVRSSVALDPADYVLADGIGPDLFHWQSVVDDRNVSGPYSIAIPGHVAGLATALERFGTWQFADILAPAIELAARGLMVDWFASLKIAAAAPILARYVDSRRIYLPHGFAPVGEWAGPLPVLSLGRLTDTLRQLAQAGSRDFYEGEIAARMVADAQVLGIKLTATDLEHYRAAVTPAQTCAYRDARVSVVPGLTAGPTLQTALHALQALIEPSAATRPSERHFIAYARALTDAYANRLASLGANEHGNASTCTTHIGVTDRHGNVVCLTQTLLSVFGSKLVLPQTGILMNNGIMWFDPRPERPNSIAPGRRPLSNMCPTLVRRPDGERFAIGASGGRRILPAVLQMTSFLVDCGLPLDVALRMPRIDVSGDETITVDDRLDAPVIDALRCRFSIEAVQNRVYPNYFACPNIVGYDPARQRASGAAFLMSPWAAACAEEAVPSVE